MSALDTEPFPRGALMAASAMIGLALFATTAVRLSRILSPPSPPTAAAAPAPLASIDLRVADQSDGSIRITRAADGSLAATVHSGEGGFIRGVMRGLARDRISRHIGAEPPFRLSLDRERRLWLLDTATGRLIDLESFGASNRNDFFKLLNTKTATISASQRIGARSAAATARPAQKL
jgi:putative photosynthetic complex assembly protein